MFRTKRSLKYARSGSYRYNEAFPDPGAVLAAGGNSLPRFACLYRRSWINHQRKGTDYLSSISETLQPALEPVSTTTPAPQAVTSDLPPIRRTPRSAETVAPDVEESPTLAELEARFQHLEEDDDRWSKAWQKIMPGIAPA